LAQDEPAALNNLLVQVYNSGPDSSPYFTVFTPEGQTAFNEPYQSNQIPFYSPDGTAKAVFTTPENGIGSYEVGTAVGQVTFEVAANYTYIAATFSRDSKWFLYTQAKLDPQHWLLGMVEIATGKRLEYIGKYDATGQLGERLIGIPQDFDGTRLLLIAVYPFTESSFGGLYAMPLPDLAPVAEGQYGMPNVTPILLADTNIASWKLSPDGTKLAYLANDIGNPPAAFQPLGPVPTVNILGVIDLATAEKRTLAVAGPGQALGQMAWSPDSSTLYFTGGNYQNTYYLVLANLYVVALSDAAVTPAGLAVTDPALFISQMEACGNTLYAAISRDPDKSGGNSEAILVSAPLETPAAFSSLATGPGFFLQGCTSRS
jgi:hypothetical protein